jgi:hypothetical protein
VALFETALEMLFPVSLETVITMAPRLLLRLLEFASAASAVVVSSPTCQTDSDCSLNGICTPKARAGPLAATSACVCDVGWKGSDCSALSFLPAKRDSGYNRTAEGISSWGSKIIPDQKDPGLHHLVLAEFTHNCGLDYWAPYSRIIRAESTTGPEGPYTYSAEIVSHFAHNPTVVWSEAEKLYLMYYIGCHQSVPSTCTNVDFTCGPGNFDDGESGISVQSSPDLKKWTAHGQVMHGNNGDNWDADLTNPSPWPFYTPSNKTDAMLLVYRGCAENCSSIEQLNVASSSSGFLGPYVKNTPNPIFDNPVEDPFVWQDKRGNWHLLMHSVEADGGFGSGPKVGRHAYAEHWEGPLTFVNTTLAYNTTIDYDDGTSINFYRRERPQLLFSDDGEMTPLYLTSGVQAVNSAQSYSTIVPIGKAKGTK